MNPSKQEVLAGMNAQRFPFLKMLGCEIVDLDLDHIGCTMHFDVSTDFCHSGNVIQGGFVTAMLDSVCAHAAFGCIPDIAGLFTLELKVSYLGASTAGKYTAIGKMEKLTHNFAFMRSDLYNESGERTASLTTTAKIKRKG